MAWQKGTSFLVPSDSPVEKNAIFLNTVANLFEICGVIQPALPPPNTWLTLDLTPLGVPPNAIAVDLRGFMIITDGSGTGTADLAISFKSPASSMSIGNYEDQTIAIGPTDGSRTHGTAVVPCINGCINWGWLRGDASVGEFPGNPIPAYPQGAGYALNISLQTVFLP